MKLVCGLGNPGSEYADTRHNVGWWVVDRAQAAWRFPGFRRDGAARSSTGRLDDHDLTLLKPHTYMNRSGSALAPWARREDFDITRDLLVVVDDAALDVGRVRFRASGSSGGHNGLKSIEAVLRSRDYPRLRVGVGQLPAGVELADWVLSPMEPQDDRTVRELLPELVDALAVWVEAGVEAAANRFNR